LDIAIDTSALLAVIANEPERDDIIELRAEHSLIGPGSIPWEIGNAFSAMLKQHRIDLAMARRGVEIFEEIPLRYVSVNLTNALSMAHDTKTCAYDAYFLDCAARHGAPLLTLDRTLRRAAAQLGIEYLEV
jgi:predicted nucleic acid-binding protein